MSASGSHQHVWRKSWSASQPGCHNEGQQHPGDDTLPKREALVLLLGVVQPSVHVSPACSMASSDRLVPTNEVVARSGSQLQVGSNSVQQSLRLQLGMVAATGRSGDDIDEMWFPVAGSLSDPCYAIISGLKDREARVSSLILPGAAAVEFDFRVARLDGYPAAGVPEVVVDQLLVRVQSRPVATTARSL